MKGSGALHAVIMHSELFVSLMARDKKSSAMMKKLRPCGVKAVMQHDPLTQHENQQL